jgi:hypothetical protein
MRTATVLLALLCAAASVVAVGVSGCGSVGGTALNGAASPLRVGLSGRLTAPPGVALEGTTVIAEEVIGGRTATVRAITATRDPAGRSGLLARVQAGERTLAPGSYTTTALPDGSFRFPNLPAGEYCITARQQSLVGVRSGVRVGTPGASVAAVHLAAQGTVNGKVRYAQPNVPTPDNSGILAFVKGTSFIGYSQGASGDYSIPGVPTQTEQAPFYTVVAMATGFADATAELRERLVGASVTAPLIFLQGGVIVGGRTYDSSISDVNNQGIAGVSIVAATGQSTTTDSEGFFQLQGLAGGSNFLTITKSGYKPIRQQIGPLLANAAVFYVIRIQRN